jgi:hypothetical protein
MDFPNDPKHIEYVKAMNTVPAMVLPIWAEQ